MAFRAVGSIWGKWDLHFHTPASFDYSKKNVTNKEIVDGLVAADVELVAITDHHVIDVTRIQELQKLGGDKLTVLPGIEFRSELGGNEAVHYRTVLNSIYYFVYNEQWNKKPFAGFDGVAEAILDLNIQLSRIKDAVDEIFQLHSVDVIENIGGDDFHVGE